MNQKKKSKVNKKRKGDLAEAEVKKIYESKKYAVEPAQRTMRCIGKGRFVSSANDYFGHYDGVAKRYGLGSVWYQVKSNSCDVYHCLPEIKKFHDTYMEQSEVSCVWLRVLRKGFVVWHYFGTGDWQKIFLDPQGYPCAKFIYS